MPTILRVHYSEVRLEIELGLVGLGLRLMVLSLGLVGLVLGLVGLGLGLGLEL